MRATQKSTLSTFGRDLGLNADQIHNFIFNGADLTPDQKRAVCQYLWAGNTVWDEATDRLMPAKREPATPLGVFAGIQSEPLPKYAARRDANGAARQRHARPPETETRGVAWRMGISDGIVCRTLVKDQSTPQIKRINAALVERPLLGLSGSG